MTNAREVILHQVMRFADPVDLDVGNWDICTDNILKALKEKGLVIVPREPTEKMKSAGRILQDRTLSKIWRAMVEVANEQ